MFRSTQSPFRTFDAESGWELKVIDRHRDPTAYRFRLVRAGHLPVTFFATLMNVTAVDTTNDEGRNCFRKDWLITAVSAPGKITDAEYETLIAHALEGFGWSYDGPSGPVTVEYSQRKPGPFLDDAGVSVSAHLQYPIPPGEVWSDKVDGIAPEAIPLMTIVPAGRFVIGASDAHRQINSGIDAATPQRRVNIDYVFAVGIFPITVAQFAAFAAETGFEEGEHATIGPAAGEGSARVGHGAGWRHPGFPQGDQQPVTCVSWSDAQAYLVWLNNRLHLTGKPDAYRLLSESEWEYVCRENSAGTAHEPPFCFGDAISTDLANFNGNTESHFCPKGIFRAATTKVGLFPANGFGVFDMHGNVWEWCQDVQTNRYDTLPLDGSPQQRSDAFEGFPPEIKIPDEMVGRVIRGGSWLNDASVLQSAYRSRTEPSERNNYLGFRIARTMAT